MAESLQNRGERGLKMEGGGPYSYTRPFSQWSSIQLHARTEGTEVSEIEDPSWGGGASVEMGGASVEMGGEENLPPQWGVKDAVFHEKGLS